MKRKAYIVPALEVHTITIQQMICGSLTGVSGDSGVGEGEGDPEPPGGGDSRRYKEWDDEEDEDW